MIIDSHCHLIHRKFKEEGYQIPQLIEDAKKNNVLFLNSISITHKEFPELLQVANTYPEVACTYGIHPHHAGEENVTYQDIIEASSHKKVIGIGETGLDYFYNNAPKEAQIKSFEMHLEASAEANLPVVIHTREAEKDTASLLEKHLKNHPQSKILFHCFSSSEWLADWGFEHGIYFSASGIVTFKKSTDLQDIFKRVDASKLLVETDAPYLAPTPHRGKICLPSYTRYTLEFLADLREELPKILEKETTENFLELFPKAQPLIAAL